MSFPPRLQSNALAGLRRGALLLASAGGLRACPAGNPSFIDVKGSAEVKEVRE